MGLLASHPGIWNKNFVLLASRVFVKDHEIVLPHKLLRIGLKFVPSATSIISIKTHGIRSYVEIGTSYSVD